MKKTATAKKIAKKSKREIKKKLKTTFKPAKKKIKKIRIKKEPEMVIKKVVAKIEKKPKKIAKKVIAKIEKIPKKVAKKVVTKIKVKVKVEKKPEKVVAKVKKKVEAKIKVKEKPKKVAKKVVVKVEKKIPIEAIKEVKPRKIIEKPKEKVEAKVELKKPVIQEKYPPAPLEILPKEYDENNITLMTVDPSKLFTFWEVREDTLATYEGNLNVRVYDVTGVEFDGTNANSYFDIAVSERIGSRYIDVGPEKEFITDIGIINPEGVFITIARSNKVLTPRITISEEVILPQKLYDTGFRIGY